MNFFGLVLPFLLLVPGIVVGGRCMKVGPASPEDGVSPLGAVLAGVDAGLAACVVWALAMVTGLAAHAGPESLVSGPVSVFGSAWVGCFLLILGFRPHARCRKGSAVAVLGIMTLIVLVYTGSGLVVGTLAHGAAWEGAIVGVTLGAFAAAFATIGARRRANKPAPRERARPAVSVELRRVLDALPGTIARGGPAALAGCALSALPAVALAHGASSLRADTLDAILGPFVTLAILAALVVVFAPAHAVAIVAFTRAARGERPALGATLWRGLALVPRIAPLTFLLLAFPHLWHVVLAYTGHRWLDGCALILLCGCVPPTFFLWARYAFVAPALATGDTFARALLRARALGRGRGALLSALVLAPVAAIAFSPFHEEALHPLLRSLARGLANVTTDGEAWCFFWKTVSHGFAATPVALALEIARVVGAGIFGCAVVSVAFAVVRVPNRIKRDAPTLAVVGSNSE